jgi:hypothetical protein
MTMRFEARELKPYGEPISKNDLKEGAVYFFLNFEDDKKLIPRLQPVVYGGRNLEPGDDALVYFQDLSSHRVGVRYSAEEVGPGATFFCGSENELGHVFRYEQALDSLLACSLRRRDTGMF